MTMINLKEEVKEWKPEIDIVKEWFSEDTCFSCDKNLNDFFLEANLALLFLDIKKGKRR